MTLFISIFSILMVILANHPTDSGAVPKSNLQEEVLTEVRLQRSSAGSHMKKRPKRAKKNQGGRKFDPNFEFRACDYLDLVEVGYS